ncbi:MAG TPA: hypothetical protein VL326_00955 [Kofleriaceae bacterium]|jgi:hypothetical protein|nr:hypothetical protein [Kofleriaceae bacterium]
MKKLAALALLLMACHPDEDYKKQKPPEETKPVVSEAKPPPPPPKKMLTPEELGKCTLTVSGAAKLEQTSLGGRTATNITYWMSPEEKKNIPGLDGFVVNCNGPDIKFSITPIGKPELQPFAPKKYTFKAGHADGASVNVLFPSLGQTATLGDPAGTIDITAFDKTHIAGTINLSGKGVGKGLKGNITLTGSFDFKCPGFGGCEM